MMSFQSKNLPTSEVELTISCRGLLCKDVLSKSDPMCVTYFRPFGEQRWVEYHRTECINETHDPQFASKCQIVYRFEEQQPLRFEIYDCDSSSSSLNDHELIGVASCTLAQIVNSGKLEIKLKPEGYTVGVTELGYIQIVGEELSSVKDEVIFKLQGQNLDKKDWFGKSDPFLEIFKSTEKSGFILAHRTEEIKNTLDPKWKEFIIPIRNLCNGDSTRTLKFVCYDWNRNGENDLIGEFVVDLKTLLDDSGPRKFTLINPKKKTKSGYKGSGEIIVERCYIRQINTFVDYIKGGTQLFCTFAIDFTGSNGDPHLPDSLHHVSEKGMNLYEQAIFAVGSIIEEYDSDKKFPVLGFGAKLPDGNVSHEFFVNMTANPYCEGVAGVLQAYKNFISLVNHGQAKLFGPTNFAPVINHVARFASAYTDGSNYFILLILTDGIITDMPETCKAIVNASKLPISIIIVGVGTADFSAMEELDGDSVALQAGGERASRDIVQFVPFSKFTGVHLPLGDLLAREVLAEIPDQLVGFMKTNNIKPKPPVLPGFRI